MTYLDVLKHTSFPEQISKTTTLMTSQGSDTETSIFKGDS